MVRKIVRKPVVELSVLAGNSNRHNLDGTGTQASFITPIGLAYDVKENVLFVGGDGALRRLTLPNAKVTTIPTNGVPSLFAATLVITKDGTLLAGCHNTHCVYAIQPSNGGHIVKLAGVGTPGSTLGKTADRTFFNYPFGLAFDEWNEIIYVADHHNSRILSLQLTL